MKKLVRREGIVCVFTHPSQFPVAACARREHGGDRRFCSSNEELRSVNFFFSIHHLAVFPHSRDGRQKLDYHQGSRVRILKRRHLDSPYDVTHFYSSLNFPIYSRTPRIRYSIVSIVYHMQYPCRLLAIQHTGAYAQWNRRKL